MYIKHKIKCPICGATNATNLYHEDMFSGPLGIEEEYHDCKRCGYGYQFAYGGHLLIVGSEWFVWSYHDYYNHNYMAKLNKKINKAMFMAKRRWKKYHKGTTVKDCPAIL